jgi:hypothetical protein
MVWLIYSFLKNFVPENISKINPGLIEKKKSLPAVVSKLSNGLAFRQTYGDESKGELVSTLRGADSRIFTIPLIVERGREKWNGLCWFA